MHGEESAFSQFVAMMLLPDNIPIVGMMVLLFYFTYLAFREMRKNDQLIAQGKRDEVLKEMQE
jgi:Na+/H+ antiporter NhaD/arsenite permease-like protein